MKVEVDQSGKVEYTKTHTILADSLGNILIFSARNKRDLLEIYRLMDKSRVFIFDTFAVLLAMLIAHSFSPTNEYVVDIEYPGNMRRIKGLTLKILRKMGKPAEHHQVNFNLITKKSLAHQNAYMVYTKKSNKNQSLNINKIKTSNILFWLLKP